MSIRIAYTYLIVWELNEAPLNAFLSVLFLLHLEHKLVELLLQPV
jgi:hypothetical protein